MLQSSKHPLLSPVFPMQHALYIHSKALTSLFIQWTISIGSFSPSCLLFLSVVKRRIQCYLPSTIYARFRNVATAGSLCHLWGTMFYCSCCFFSEDALFRQQLKKIQCWIYINSVCELHWLHLPSPVLLIQCFWRTVWDF